MRWADPDRLAGLPRWDNFHPTFIRNLLSHFNQKVSYVLGKRLSGFTFLSIFYRKQWPKAVRSKLWQNFDSFKQSKCSYIIQLTFEKPKKPETDWSKLYFTLPGWPTCACSYGRFSSHLGGIPGKSSEIPPRRAGSLFIWTPYIFIGVYKKREISPRWVSPPKRDSSPPYEQLRCWFYCVDIFYIKFNIHRNKFRD